METLDYGGHHTDVTTPKEEFTIELFADMMTFYVRNANSLSPDEREDFARLDHAANARQLVSWAENIHITGCMGDLTAIDLANIIRNTDEASLSDLLKKTRLHPRIINEKLNAITAQAERTRSALAESPAILFRNGEGNFTALGEDAKAIAQKLALMPDDTLGDIPVINIGRPGVALLEHNNIPYHITEPATDIAFAYEEDNDVAQGNRLLTQMGLLAVLSKGDTVRYHTGGKIFGNEETIELRNGLFLVTSLDTEDRMELTAVPLQLFNTADGQSESYLTNLDAKELHSLRDFFNSNFDSLAQATKDYTFARKALDENLVTLIGQNDHLSRENPDTIILIKQRGFIEAFSDSAINVAGTLGLPLYNRSDHKGYLTVPFTRMTVDDYKRLYETDSNVYLARPSAQDSLTEANLTKVKPNTIPPAQQGNPEEKRSERHSIRR